MATHSTILAWRIPWTEKPGGLHGVAESDRTGQLSLVSRHCHHRQVLVRACFGAITLEGNAGGAH